MSKVLIHGKAPGASINNSDVRAVPTPVVDSGSLDNIVGNSTTERFNGFRNAVAQVRRRCNTSLEGTGRTKNFVDITLKLVHRLYFCHRSATGLRPLANFMVVIKIDRALRLIIEGDGAAVTTQPHVIKRCGIKGVSRVKGHISSFFFNVLRRILKAINQKSKTFVSPEV